jgi:predicted TIM-barrel fold metal-dependent hydrolase
MDPQPLHHVWNYTDVDRAFWAEHLEGWLPERIIDAHTHVNDPQFQLEPMTEQKRRQYWVNEVLEPIGPDDARRCCDIVYPNREVTALAFGLPSLEFDIDASNDHLIAAVNRLDWYALAVTRPQWPVEKVAALLDRPRVLGVKVYYALISQDSESRDRHIEASIFTFLPHHQLELLNDRRAWVTLHVPRKRRLGDPANIEEVRQIRRRYPDIKLVIAHFGRCYTLPHAREAIEPLADDDGLLFDNSAVLNPDVHRYAMQRLGANRILYGTDNPIFYMRGRRQWSGRFYHNRTSYPFHFNKDREPPDVEAAYTLYLYEALRAIRQAADQLGWTRRQVEAIFHDNARRLIDGIEADKRQL